VFGPDALENTTPLSKEVNNPAYDAAFGAIEYRLGQISTIHFSKLFCLVT